jgi:carbonic anhydrase
MTDLTTLLNRNEKQAAQFQAGRLQIRPRLSTIVLTCLDARVDPAHLFQLEPGDALVIRNAGGRFTPAVMRDLAVLGVLAANLPGNNRPTPPDLAILHHTDCGMARMADPRIQQQVAQRLGLANSEVAAMAVVDPALTVRADIEKLRNTSAAPDALVVAGLVYDVTTGKVTEIVEPTSLRRSREAEASR